MTVFSVEVGSMIVGPGLLAQLDEPIIWRRADTEAKHQPSPDARGLLITQCQWAALYESCVSLII